MCGIVGVVGDRPVVDQILGGLQRLEYRGYDSAGLATIEAGAIRLVRTKGKLARLREAVALDRPAGSIGIGHTRWATHGAPSEVNAHPHSSCTGAIVLVHNGIIENHREIRKRLIARGHTFRSETDTEVVVHLIEDHGRKLDPERAFRKAMSELVGNFAIVTLFADRPGQLFGARMGSPLVVGLGTGQNFLASDVPAIFEWTRRVIYLEEGEMAVVDGEGARVTDFRGRTRPAVVREVEGDLATAEKGGFPHFMLKEIHEQAQGVRATLGEREVSGGDNYDFDELMPRTGAARRFRRVLGIACGTALHAAWTGKYAVEELTGLPMEICAASEFRYGSAPVDRHTLVLAVSQSGETADTLAGVRSARERGAWVIAVTNVVGSSLAREADGVLYTRAGLEIGVAATKTYTAQLTALHMLAIYFGRMRGRLTRQRGKQLVQELRRLPRKIQECLRTEDLVLTCAEKYKSAPSFMYIARRNNFPNALEGALKLKEISYLHAEGYPGGEMKHGPLALVDQTFPTVAIAVAGSVYEKMLSNIQEIKARLGIVIAIASSGDTTIATLADTVIHVPQTEEMFSPILTVIPLQLLAYHIAVKRGCDVDQPRNLAKSVTVE